MPMGAQAPVGVFDSGIGGLSVLRHIRTRLPREDLLYVADAGFVPYGDKTDQEVIQRSQAVAAFLHARGIKALVVACNTATAAAIQELRERYPDLPVIGVEPGLKPAAGATRSGTVGVLATERTLSSAKFLRLLQSIGAASGVSFLLQPCIGLADQVEKGELRSAATAALVRRYVAPLLDQGADTLVLGCTHYPFVQPLVERVAARTGKATAIIDTGEAVARQLERVLAQRGLLREDIGGGAVSGFTTGSRTALQTAFTRLLQLEVPAHDIADER
jgi:glutamate racemase